ncbi:MAG: DUF1549 domain-containing protein, partial [Verrucomicrobiae bacterium]|nr:DUF1549 domain-containing protein [Verrucomicrobiae bacterium]
MKSLVQQLPGTALFLAVAMAFGMTPPPSFAADPGAVDFNRDIRPLLSSKCVKCHGPDEHDRKADLRLDIREGALADLGGYAAIKPGDAAASELIARLVTDDPEELMPPPKSGPALEAKEIETLRRWIEEGAAYAEHWSFVKPTRPEPPKNGIGGEKNAIDHFVRARLEAEGLKSRPEADPYSLLRRLSIDLVGLPPRPEESGRFAEAWKKAGTEEERDRLYLAEADRLLASEAFGERWAAPWLDLARYADSMGYASDNLRTIWAYRDWVIGAMNRNVPYDRFTLEQLAGDLIPDASPETRIATAFHRNTMNNTEGGTDNEEFRVAAVKDRVNTTMQVWMGLTMNCAECHSHKYDPITQAEYYRFYDFFNQTADVDTNDDAPTLPV